MVRVTHPHHPLYNQVVNVLRRAAHPVYREPCYLIELPDGTRAELPVTWTAAATEEVQTAAIEQPVELWAGIAEYLLLAAVRKALSSSVAEEVADEQAIGPTQQRAATAHEQPGGASEPAQAGRPSGSQPAGTDRSTGSVVDASSVTAAPAGGAP